MEVRELICIGCPMGCPLKVELVQGQALKVTGNNCGRGEAYAKKEVSHPARIVTSSVKVEGGTQKVVSVKTKEDIPKEKIFDVIKFFYWRFVFLCVLFVLFVYEGFIFVRLLKFYIVKGM